MIRTKALKKILEDQGRSQSWLAKQIGMKPQAFRDILRDRRDCSKEDAKAIAKALGVALNEVWNTDL